MGAIILFSFVFFVLGVVVATKIVERKKIIKTMDEVINACEGLYNKDYPETHKWLPAIKYSTACDIVMKLCNPHDRPVMDTGNGEQATAQIIAWLLDEIKKDKVKWYKNYTLHGDW